MAEDLELKIKVAAETTAAQAAIGGLAADLGAMARASDGAGAATKSLSKRTAEATAAVGLQREAVERGKRAQAEAGQIAAAFGRDSREAADAQFRLRLAQEAATKASRDAERALAATARAVREAAAGADDKARPAIQRMATQLERAGKEADRSSAELRILDARIVAVGASSTTATRGAASLTKNISALSVAGGTLAAAGVSRAITGISDGLAFTMKSAIGFESQMADVAKVVDGMKTPAGQATAAYHEMSAELLSLSERIAVTPEGFAEIAAAAGQAGIAGAELTKFAEDAAETAVAFDVTADAAGDGLAKLRTGLQLSQPEVMSLAGTINVLSNKFAATAAQVLEATQKVGSIGKAANISAQEMAALATSMIASGASAEQAATGTKNFVLALSIGSSATKAQQSAYKALGMEAEAVARKMTSDNVVERAEQMREVVEKIGKLSNAKRVSVMADLFGKETLGTIGPLATNIDLLTQSLAAAGDETAALSSVQAEFEARSSTTANTLQLLKNSIAATAITVGNELLPEIGAMAKDLSAWVRENRELIKVNVIAFVHGLAEAVRGLAPLFFGITGTIGKVISVLGGMERAIGPVVAGLGAMKIASAAALGPWGLLIGAVVAGGMAIADAWADAEKRTMSVIRQAERMRLIKTQEATVEKAGAAELLRMRREIDEEEKKNRTIQGDMRGLSPTAIKKQEQERQADMAAIKVRKKALDDALAVKTAELEVTVKTRREAEAQAAIDKTRADRMKLELDHLNTIGDLSKAQAKRKRELERGGIESDVEPETKKGRGGGGKKDKAVKPSLREYDSKIADDYAKMMAELREREIAAEQKAFDDESKLRERKLTAIDREKEALEALGGFEAERVDAVFYSIEVESEAQRQREELIDRRLDAETKIARWQIKAAKSEADREQARTRLENVEHQKRITGLRRYADAEAKEHRGRAKVVEGVTRHVTGLGEAVVSGLEAAANGERGAIARMVAQYLKGVRDRMAIKALEEGVLAVAAAASYNYPAAAAHGAAAGLAIAAAAAAGGGAFAAGKIADARSGGAKPATSTTDGPAANDSGSANGGSGDGDLEAQETPVSHERLRRGDGAAQRTGGAVVHIYNPQIVGAGGVRDFARAVKREIDREARGGARPKN